MKLAELYKKDPFVLSYELFPPKTDLGRRNLSKNLKQLTAFHPDFITCTYGAGGGARENTLSTLRLVQENCDVPVASHLTCVGASVSELRAYLRAAAEQGIDHIVALRGDPDAEHSTFQATEGGLRHANELVELIRSEFPQFGIAVGGYPETHPEALGPEVDIENLKRKVDAGADVVVTQLYFDNTVYYDFRDRCERAGITVPIVPGILPVTNYAQTKRITSLCGAKMPEGLTRDFERLGDDTEGQFQVGVAFAIEQVKELAETGVPGIHFYVLNKSPATTRVLTELDRVPHRMAD